jgi:hypothetical protein
MATILLPQLAVPLNMLVLFKSIESFCNFPRLKHMERVQLKGLKLELHTYVPLTLENTEYLR